MPVVGSSIEVPVDAATAFAVSQTTGEVRLRWDPFIRRQRFLRRDLDRRIAAFGRACTDPIVLAAVADAAERLGDDPRSPEADGPSDHLPS